MRRGFLGPPLWCPPPAWLLDVKLALFGALDECIPLALIEVERILAGVPSTPDGSDAFLAGNGYAVDDATRLGRT